MTGKIMSEMEMISRAEQTALISLSLHGLLIKADMADEARLAWTIYLNASALAEEMGERIGVEVSVA